MVTTLLDVAGWPENGVFRRVSSRLSARSALLVSCVLMLAAGNAAHAQSAVGEPVDVAGNRPQPGYDATGVPLGAARLYPALGVTSTYDGNVFARDTAVEADVSATFVPSLRIEWARPGRQVSLNGDLRIRRYAKLSRQDDEQYRAEAAALLEVARDTQLSAGAGWTRSTASRGTFENGLQTGGPLRQERLWGQALVRHRFNRLSLNGRVSADEFRFDEVLLDDGTMIDQSFRNGRRIGGQLSGGYEIGPRFSIVARGTLDRYEYRNTAAGLTRDATGYMVTAGVRYELTRLLVAEIGAGVRKHDFDDPALGDISGLAPSAQIRWYPTPLLSLRFDITHSTTTSAFNTIAAVAVTGTQLSADYELRRNLIVSVATDLSHEDYGPGNGVSGLWSVSSQAAWKPNRLFRLTGRLSYDRRSSSAASFIPEFDALRVTLSAAIAR